MTSRPCPERSTLEALLKDTLPVAQQAELEEHLGRCAACRKQLEVLAIPTQFSEAGGDSSAIRSLASSPLPPRELIEQWRRAEAHAPTREPWDAVASVLARLEPAEEAGELGRLGPYRILRLLGQGGMGLVLLADDSVLRRPVAIKFMRPELAEHPEARERFLREARAAAAVRHEGVVVIHAVESGAEPPFLVMEYVPGRSLQRRLDEEGPLPAGELAGLGAQVAEGLAAAHERGLVHRDVKPANILIDERTGRAKLTDFGLARAGDDPSLTRLGFVAGTPAYIAPEQAWGRPVDHRADLYALGATLFAAATGRPPLTDTSALNHRRKPGRAGPPSIRVLAPHVPSDLARMIEGLLAVDPSGRPASAAKIADALRGATVPQRRSRPVRLPMIAAASCCAGVLGLGLAPVLRDGWEPARPPALIPPAPAAASQGPFVLDGARHFGSLREAIEAAPSGAVIEVVGDGPYPTGAIRTGEKVLAIRAATGSRPQLVYTPENPAAPGPWIVSDSPLSLEGLRLTSNVSARGKPRPGEDPHRFCAVVAREGPLRVAHCEFAVAPRSGCLAVVGGSGEVRACLFNAPQGVAFCWVPGPGQSIALRSNLIVARRALRIDIDRLDVGPGEARLRLDGSTIRASVAFAIVSRGDPRGRNFADPSRLDARIESARNLFDASSFLVMTNSSGPGRLLSQPVSVISRVIRSRVNWEEADNLYPPAPLWLTLAVPGRPSFPLEGQVRTLADWERFWGLNATGSATAQIEFRAGHGSSSAADHTLVSAWVDGEPIPLTTRGADVSAIGPGPAYDAWRASASYATWPGEY